MPRCWLLLACWLLAAPTWGAPLDLVPRGDFSYDVLASLARRGLLPGVSARSLHGDELKTRAEVAALVARAVEHAREELSSGTQAVLAQLVREYQPELGGRAEELLRQLDAPSEGGFGGGYVLGRLFTGDRTGTNWVYRVDGAYSANPYVLVNTSVTNERRLWSDRPTAFTQLGRLTVRLRTKLVRWELGKRDEYWGPGYSGAMLLSDNAPPSLALRGEATLKLGFLGTWEFVQMSGTFEETSGRKYVIARRFSRQFGKRWRLSLAEAAKTTTARQIYAGLVLPLYLYGKILDEDDPTSQTLNYLANLQLSVSTGRHLVLYGDLVLDDVTAPFELGPVDVGRKLGFLVGATIRPLKESDRTEIRLEYVLTDGDDPGFAVEGGTYWHRNPDLAWFHDGLVMGHRMSRNRRGPFVRVRHRLTDQWTAIAEWEHHTQFRATPVVGDRRRLSLYAAYDLKPDRSLAIRLDRFRGAPGNRTLVELQGAYSF